MMERRETGAAQEPVQSGAVVSADGSGPDQMVGQPAPSSGSGPSWPAEPETRAKRLKIWDPGIVRRAIVDSFGKLDPRHMARNPVMFVVEIGSVITTVIFFGQINGHNGGEALFIGQITVWLWFTVLFANFAEAMAEGRGKAQADTLRRTRSETTAKVERGSRVEEVPSSQLRAGDVVHVSAGDMIPGDGEIIEGIP